jgi:hypothetical protein
MFKFPKYIDTSLEQYIDQEKKSIFELTCLPYLKVKDLRSNIDEFILNYSSQLEDLDYDNLMNRSFLYLLFDFCELLQLKTSFEQLCLLAYSQKIIGHRLRAAIFINVNISFNSNYIDRFEKICELLDKAINEEEDDYKKSLATFIYYYLSVAQCNPKWIIKLRSLINEKKENYQILQYNEIDELLCYNYLDYSFLEGCANELIDKLFERIITPNNSHYMLESGNYADILKSNNTASFKDIRSIAIEKTQELQIKKEDRGTTVYDREDQLYMYLYSCGNMHYAKLDSCFDELNLDVFNNTIIHVIDWGCGQAIGIISLYERMKKEGINCTVEITLIEPSEIAIKRAALHVQVVTGVQAKTVCKYLDDITEDDLRSKRYPEYYIHLFSNILDIESFSLRHVEEALIKSCKGNNYFVCVSPYINDLKNYRVMTFAKDIMTHKSCSKYQDIAHIENSKYDQTFWNCNNLFKLNICSKKSEDNCKKCSLKWTRVMRVFEAELSII